jgi:hypothetical protein
MLLRLLGLNVLLRLICNVFVILHLSLLHLSLLPYYYYYYYYFIIIVVVVVVVIAYQILNLSLLHLITSPSITSFF